MRNNVIPFLFMYFTLFSQMIHDNFSSLETYINIFYDIITIDFKNVSCICEGSYYYIGSLEVKEK
ncbi:hypothetical protein DN389_25935 [Bacillus sp. AY3-1]|uniref:Uncharacterized protein n=1 Tax=Bacillus wiedmannii TaxID=1890302 RepID=A0A2A7DJ73_9BACI|nr:hypothetical protein DN389_25935 [Bacillus sp. AY3-1]PDZ43148.1 hypothetical protein CON82_25485 [Bacillus wiedmannii]PHB05105.1 hypothetical protein COE81_19040 [Bacillus wiedmannii]PHD62927.1 hypothetical protein COF57_04875 [Bacillus wiedmannii]PRT07369.1 hypothetical protein C6356_02905 [Bacillus wiedmannii]